MKTDFPILWVDDKKELVDSLRTPLETWINNHGFSLIVHFHKNGDKVGEDLKTKDIELIILDYKLRGSKTGDEIIQEIREQNYYQDIIFYSQGGAPNDVFKRSPDGIFFVDKSDAMQRIKELIGLKINRLTDLCTLRGWIVADAIELENTLGELLATCFKDKATLFTERVLATEGIFDFGKKHRVLNGILKDQIANLGRKASSAPLIAQLEASKKILDTFDKEIIAIRNALAHQKAEILNTGKKKIRTRGSDTNEIEITHAQCVKIRQDFRKHQENLRKLKGLIADPAWA